MKTHLTRREFVATTAAGTLAAAALGGRAEGAAPTASGVPRRPFGKTGDQVSIIGIGGFHLGEPKDENEATKIVHAALDAGVNFFDNAWEYHKGVSEERLGRALVGRRDKAFLMTKVCTHGRDKKVAMQMLEQSLKRLKTDHLDLWQVHEVVYENDPDLHFAAGGVIEALDAAKKQGKVRYVGFTGHKDPHIHLKMLSHGYAFDSVQMPLNCFDGQFRSFEEQVLPEVAKRGMAALGMKSLGGTGDMVNKGIVTAEEALRYAMSLPGVTTTISGIDSLAVLTQNLAVASGFQPMTDGEREALRARVAPQAVNGRFELYKTTIRFEADEGRKQHGFPSTQELPI